MSERLFLSLTEEEFVQFEHSREQLGMYRSQFLKYLLHGQKEIRPMPIVQKQLLDKLSSVERNLKVIAIKDDLSDEEKLYASEQLKDIKVYLDKLSRGIQEA